LRSDEIDIRGFVLTLVAALMAIACSSGSSTCPGAAPGNGDPCGGHATCGYGPVSCTCDGEAWQCRLPYTPAITPGANGDDGGADDGQGTD
jgi:hypothetical protein